MTTSGPTMRPPSAVGDVVLALGVGGFAGLVAFGVPPFFAILLAGAFAALSLSTRFDVNSVAVTLLVLTSFTMPMNRLFLGPLPASDILLVMAVGLFALIRLAERWGPGPRTFRPIVIGLALLGLGGLIGAVFEAPGAFLYKALGQEVRDVSGWSQNLGNLGKFLSGSLIPMAAWVLARPSRKLMRVLLGWFVAGNVTGVFVGILLPSGRGGDRLIGLTTHPNMFGSLCLMGVGAALGLALSRRKLALWSIPVLPLLAYGILASGSRAALGGLLALCLIVGPLTGSRGVMGTLLVGAACVLLLFATGIIRPEGENAVGRALGDSSTAQGSDQVRENLGSEVWDRWQQRPITGNGYNYMRPSHNVYLGILASAGVLGVVGFLTILTTIVRRAWRRRADLMFAGIAAGYLAYAAQAYFDNVFWWRWLWFFVGMVVAVGGTDPGPDEIGHRDLVEDDELPGLLDPVDDPLREEAGAHAT